MPLRCLGAIALLALLLAGCARKEPPRRRTAAARADAGVPPAGEAAELDAFASITLRIVEKDGPEGFLPTLLLPARRKVQVLEAIPEGTPHRDAARAWAVREAAPGEAYLIAYRSGEGEITLEHHRPGRPVLQRQLRFGR